MLSNNIPFTSCHYIRENILIPILIFVRKYSIIQIGNMNIFSYI
nr:MAG TPA: hypothetical protein [Caudoviricetes sp.]